jgi:hypothetical protein
MTRIAVMEAEPGPPALGADGLPRRQMIRNDVEELIRHLRTGRVDRLPV